MEEFEGYMIERFSQINRAFPAMDGLFPFRSVAYIQYIQCRKNPLHQYIIDLIVKCYQSEPVRLGPEICG